MAQMQYLGRLDEGKSKTSQVVEAIASLMQGMQAYRKQEEEKEETEFTRGIKERETGVRERDVAVREEALTQNLKEIEYDKKKNTADMVTRVAQSLDRDAAEDFINQPEVKALFADLGWPLPTGMHEEKPAKERALEAVNAGVPLEGMTMEETKKLAGALITPPAITRDVIKSAPWQLADIIPWRESEKEKLERMRRERIAGGTPSPTAAAMASDPLGVRK